MRNKLTILAALLLLSFAASDATTKTSKATIDLKYVGMPNGDYRLFLFGSDRTLVCEEKEIKIVEQGNAVNPLVLECKH